MSVHMKRHVDHDSFLHFFMDLSICSFDLSDSDEERMVTAFVKALAMLGVKSLD
jgi:hypothetical protein